LIADGLVLCAVHGDEGDSRVLFEVIGSLFEVWL
jgi:hypothetical protein